MFTRRKPLKSGSNHVSPTKIKLFLEDQSHAGPVLEAKSRDSLYVGFTICLGTQTRHRITV